MPLDSWWDRGFGVCMCGRGKGERVSGLITSPAVVDFLTVSPDHWREPRQIKLQSSKRVTESLSLTAEVSCMWSLAPEIMKSAAITEMWRHTASVLAWCLCGDSQCKLGDVLEFAPLTRPAPSSPCHFHWWWRHSRLTSTWAQVCALVIWADIKDHRQMTTYAIKLTSRRQVKCVVSVTAADTTLLTRTLTRWKEAWNSEVHKCDPKTGKYFGSWSRN